jgi:hypothetical protein
LYLSNDWAHVGIIPLENCGVEVASIRVNRHCLEVICQSVHVKSGVFLVEVFHINWRDADSCLILHQFNRPIGPTWEEPCHVALGTGVSTISICAIGIVLSGRLNRVQISLLYDVSATHLSAAHVHLAHTKRCELPWGLSICHIGHTKEVDWDGRAVINHVKHIEQLGLLC